MLILNRNNLAAQLSQYMDPDQSGAYQDLVAVFAAQATKLLGSTVVLLDVEGGDPAISPGESCTSSNSEIPQTDHPTGYYGVDSYYQGGAHPTLFCYYGGSSYQSAGGFYLHTAYEVEVA